MSGAAPGAPVAKLFGMAVILSLVIGLISFIVLIVGEANFAVPRKPEQSEAWKPETFKVLGYILAISTFLAMVLYAFFQWGIAHSLRRTGLSVSILVFGVLELAGIVTLFIMAAQQEGFMNQGGRAGNYLAVPIQMLLLRTKEFNPNWFVVGIAGFLCLWFLVQSFILRHAVKRAMTRQPD
jgi:hypothetical protein